MPLNPLSASDMRDLAKELLRRKLKFADVVNGQCEALSDDEHETIAQALHTLAEDWA